jgi:Outer membrane protein beta-barrel domain
MCFASCAAMAGDPLGLYAGVALGDAHVRSEELRSGETTPFTFDGSSVGWSVFLGARPLTFFSVEFAYADFGSANAPSPYAGYFSANSKQNATSAFAIGHLPLPAPHLALYGKLGVALLHTRSHVATEPFDCPAGSTCSVYSVSQSQSSTNLAYGAGAQATFGSFAVRIEYERIHASGGNPDFLSLGLSRSF